MSVSPRIPDHDAAETWKMGAATVVRARPALDDRISGSAPPLPRSAQFGPIAESTPNVAERNRMRRRQLSHDIHHEVGTIMLLASLLTSAADVGEESGKRARQILGEVRWLDQLQRAYEEHVPELDGLDRPVAAAPIRLDLVAREVVDAMRLCTVTEIRLTTSEAWAHVDRLDLWRALRNVLDNARRAVGANGRVDVRVFGDGGWAVAEIDDDGPGFGAIEPGLASLGLCIVRDIVTAWAGRVENRRGRLGGCCIRLQLPAAQPDTSACQ